VNKYAAARNEPVAIQASSRYAVAMGRLITNPENSRLVARGLSWCERCAA
jgi:hypothetical protein